MHPVAIKERLDASELELVAAKQSLGLETYFSNISATGDSTLLKFHQKDVEIISARVNASMVLLGASYNIVNKYFIILL